MDIITFKHFCLQIAKINVIMNYIIFGGRLCIFIGHTIY